MAVITNVVVLGLSEFRRDLRRAHKALPRELTKALREAGKPARAAAAGRVPRGATGRTAAAFRIRASGRLGRIVNPLPHAGVLEWATTFMRKSRSPGRAPHQVTMRKGPPPPRYAQPAVASVAPIIAVIIHRELQRIITAFGWFRETGRA